MEKETCHLEVMTGLFLTIKYLHVVPFLWYEMPYSLLKTPIAHVVQGGVAFYIP